MAVYMCMKCFEVYSDLIKDIHEKSSNGITCPKKGCDGFVKEVDELYQPIIKILHQKGYITESCNCGSTWEELPESNIIFKKDLKKEDFPVEPEGFNRTTENGCVEFAAFYDEKLPEAELYRQILESASNLLKWADSLKELEY